MALILSWMTKERALSGRDSSAAVKSASSRSAGSEIVGASTYAIVAHRQPALPPLSTIPS